MRISRVNADALLAHAREAAPDECCGYLRLEGDHVAEVVRGENAHGASRLTGYELDGRSLLAANELDDAGWGVAIYHSHPRSPAEPSQTDVNLATYPHWLYVIVSPVGEGSVRAWRIAEGRYEEEQVHVG